MVGLPSAVANARVIGAGVSTLDVGGVRNSLLLATRGDVNVHYFGATYTCR